jgi:uracil-DNA glycosylase
MDSEAPQAQSRRLHQIATEIATCTACGLCASRTNTVPGTGNPNADIIFIGEGPGKSEDEQGIPFCGASGRLLDTLLQSINLRREDVFITNIVKCRPPENRDPRPNEKRECGERFLDRQIATIAPKLVVTLGRHALAHFIPNLKISEVHGQPQRHNNQVYLALYHPAVALYNGSMRATLTQDFQIIPALIAQLRTTHT